MGAVVIKWQKKQNSDSGAQNTNTFKPNLDTLTLPLIPPRYYVRVNACVCNEHHKNFGILTFNVWGGVYDMDMKCS